MPADKSDSSQSPKVRVYTVGVIGRWILVLAFSIGSLFSNNKKLFMKNRVIDKNKNQRRNMPYVL